ncbi:MAG: site-specific integrase [Thermacetogeniaceae bacterium]
MNTVEPIRDLQKIDAMKKILKSQNIRDWLLFTIGINSALRVSDLLRLRQMDLCDNRGRVLDAIRVREKKTNKEKLFRLNKSIRKALNEYMQTTPLDMDAFLFQSRKGENRPIGRGQAWEILSNAAKAVGIRDQIGTHTMRKTWGYHARMAGTDIEIIMRALNHSSQRQTLRYIGITQDEVDNAYDSICL